MLGIVIQGIAGIRTKVATSWSITESAEQCVVCASIMETTYMYRHIKHTAEIGGTPAKGCHAKVALFESGRSPHDNVFEYTVKHEVTAERC